MFQVKVLEAGRVRRVTGDRNVHVLVPEDSYAFANVVGTVAVHLRTQASGVGDALHHSHLAGVVVELSAAVGETVDAADDLGGVLAEAVQNHAQGFLAHLVGHLSNLDGTLSSSE